MLTTLLHLIRDGQANNLPELARKLQVGTALALRMTEDLTRQGFLEQVGAGCGTPGDGCADCPAGSACSLPARGWILTEKGKNAAAWPALK